MGRWIGRTAFAGLMLAMAQQAIAEDQPAISVRKLAAVTTTASGQPIRLPQGEVTVGLSEYVIAPGARLPVHKHPYPRFAYVAEGTLLVTQQETGKTTVYNPGDLIAEVVDQWHFGMNQGDVPVRLIVLDQAPTGTVNTVAKP